MFIKEAFERRLKKEQQLENEGLNQEKHKLHKIGSVRNGKINFDRDEQFFSQDDIPQKAMEIKKQIKNFIDLDILNLKKKEWNSSCSVPKNPLLEETHERKLIKIKLGLYDRPIPPLKDKIIELGTDTRNDYTGWNVSTQQDTKQRRTHLDDFTMKSKIKNKEKEDGLLIEYRKPLEQQSDLVTHYREVKKKEKEFRDEIRKEFLRSNPKSTKEKTDAAVYRLTYEAKLRINQIQQDPKVTFKPQLYKPDEDKRIKATHSGVYQKFGFEKDANGQQKDHYAWSCCMNAEKDSQGCNRQVIDKKKWIYASYVS
ncbi:hypothetical protein ABPG74_005095 [Tetrahymena malaccensis]